MPDAHSPQAAESCLTLGVSGMDDDHAAIEALFAQAPSVPDSGLPDYFQAVRQELEDHFAREETLMRQHQVPVLFCHIAQHKHILDTLGAAEEKLKAGASQDLRHFLTHELPGIVLAHVASVDRLSANFILGTADPALVARLKLQEESA